MPGNKVNLEVPNLLLETGLTRVQFKSWRPFSNAQHFGKVQFDIQAAASAVFIYINCQNKVKLNNNFE